MKVDNKFAQVRTNILMMQQLPNLSQAYRMLAQEQKHQELSLLTPSEGLAFNVQGSGNYGNRPFYKNNGAGASGHGPTVRAQGIPIGFLPLTKGPIMVTTALTVRWQVIVWRGVGRYMVHHLVISFTHGRGLLVQVLATLEDM